MSKNFLLTEQIKAQILLLGVKAYAADLSAEKRVGPDRLCDQAWIALGKGQTAKGLALAELATEETIDASE